jgi:hypothetical protein
MMTPMTRPSLLALLLISAVMHLARAANLDGSGRLGSGAFALLGGFVLFFALAMLARLVLRFGSTGGS